MLRHLKYITQYPFFVNFLSKTRPPENKTLQIVRLYTSKKGPVDSSKPLGTTKLVSECVPSDSKNTNSSKSEFNKGSTLKPAECKPPPPINKDECKRPHVDTCVQQSPKIVQTGCTPGGTNVPPRSDDCGKKSTMDGFPQPGSFKDDLKRQRTINWLLFLGAILASGVFYQYYSTNDASDKNQSKGEQKKTEKKQKKKDRWPVVSQKVPADSSDIPSNVPYLLIGSGTASFAAFRAIKSSDPRAQILVIGNEPFLPYMRPPLSKEMWYGEDRSKVEKLMFKQWNGTERSLFYEPPEFYTSSEDLMSAKNGGVAVARGWNVAKLDVNKRIAFLEDGKQIMYEKCLIATGAKPKNLPIFEKASKDIKSKISLFRNIYSFENLEDVITDGAKSIAIIGGGFLGSELACALARRGKKEELKVYQIFKENGNMAKVLPEYLSKWTTEKVKKEGVNIVGNAEVDDVAIDTNQVSLGLTNGKRIKVDHVIVAVGVEPNTDFADDAGLEVDPELGGYLVNAELEARSNLYVAGDCACFYDVKLGRRRVEHHDHAVVSGRLAGENMTGAAKPYLHQSMLWSDLGPDVGFEAIGIVDSSLNTVGVYAKAGKEDNKKADQVELTPEDYNKGVIFYLQHDVIVGIVLWNVFNRMNVARQILRENRKYEDLNEVAKLFKIHEE